MFSRAAASMVFVGLVLCAAAASAQPQISVNTVAAPTAVTVPAGRMAIVTVTGGPANATDWIGLYETGAANEAFLHKKYTVAPSTGIAGATIYEMMPVFPGEYEFRFFADDGYTLLATSSPITVAAAPAISAGANPLAGKANVFAHV